MKRIILMTTMACLSAIASAQAADQPNILWITSEDNGPHIGAYGDRFADTPNLNRLADRGMIYRYAWSTAPVCAPARTAIISGVYPTSLGAEHMRSMIPLPPGMKMYPQYLREAGYYCTNNRKEDYNLEKPGPVWDESSGEAHWKNRKEGQPFFAIFNYTITHESQIRRRPHDWKHDPEKVPIPDYHPDTPEVRKDWAQYHDKMTEMDQRVGERIQELKEAGLLEETVIFYYGDHGPGMPRSKRWTYNSGLHIPLIVSIPEKYRELAPKDYKTGGESDRLIAFVDLAPTVLSLAGIPPPETMQGRAFMGGFNTAPKEFLFGLRGRMDERYDMVRAVRNERYIYIRNYNPHKIYGQHIDYMFQTPTTRVWKELYDKGELEPPKTYFWETKPAEELYDLWNDPDETMNLAHSAQHQPTLKRFRQALGEWQRRTRDLGFLPENQLHSRSLGMSPYEMGNDEETYPLQSIRSAAEVASSLESEVTPQLILLLQDADEAIRYWGAMGLLMRGEPAVQSARPHLRQALRDMEPSVRIAAAEALGRYGDTEDLDLALGVLRELGPLDKNGLYVSMLALNAIDKLDDKAAPLREEMKDWPRRDSSVHGRMGNYVDRLLSHILEE